MYFILYIHRTVLNKIKINVLQPTFKHGDLLNFNHKSMGSHHLYNQHLRSFLFQHMKVGSHQNLQSTFKRGDFFTLKRMSMGPLDLLQPTFKCVHCVHFSGVKHLLLSQISTVHTTSPKSTFFPQTKSVTPFKPL